MAKDEYSPLHGSELLHINQKRTYDYHDQRCACILGTFDRVIDYSRFPNLLDAIFGDELPYLK